MTRYPHSRKTSKARLRPFSRGGYIFDSWIGDHGNHVHVFREGKLVLKWDLDHDCEVPGSKAASRKIKDLIHELKADGKLQYENKKSNR